MRLYESLLRAHPEVLPARLNFAGMLMGIGKVAEAIELYRAGLRLTPASTDLQLGLAEAYGRQGTPEGLKTATAALEMMHRRDPADEKASMLLADSYLRQSRPAEALPLLAPLEQAHPDDNSVAWLTGTALLAAGRREEALQRIDAVATRTGDAQAYLLAGQTRLDLQQFDLAKADALAALKKPDLPGGQTLLGRALEHLGDYDASTAALRRALAEDDADFQAHFYLGAVLLFQRDLSGADVQLKRALALEPASAEARYKLALVEQAEGRNEAALADLGTVIGQRPKWLEPQTTRVALLYKLHRNDEAAQAKEAADKVAATQEPGAPGEAAP